MTASTKPRWSALCALITLAAACAEPPGAPSPDPGGQPATSAAPAAATSAPRNPSAEAAATASAAPSAAEAPASPSAKAAAASAASASASAEPAGTVKGKEESEAMYATWLQSAGRYVVGQPASVQAVLVAKAGYKCNDKYPYKFKLDAAPEGVSYADTVARDISLGKARSVLTIPFTPTSKGKKTIRGTFFFSVCDDTTCKIKKAPMSVTVEVSES